MDDAGPGGEDWEDQFLDQLVELLRGMNLSIDKAALRSMMEQFRGQFDKLGLDPEKLAKGDIKLNLQADLSDLAKLFGGGDPSSLLRNLTEGLASNVAGAAPTVEIDPVEDTISDTLRPEDADIFEIDDEIHVTLDVSRHVDLERIGVELALLKQGAELHVMQANRPAPLHRLTLPRMASEVVDHVLNNGILDVTLRAGAEPTRRGGNIPIL